MNQEIMYNSRNTTKAWKLQRKTTKAQQLGATTRSSHRAKARHHLVACNGPCHVLAADMEGVKDNAALLG